YRSLTEQLFGLAGHPKGLFINPQLPKGWSTARVSRRFRNATFNVRYTRSSGRRTRIEVDGQPLDTHIISDIKEARTYRVEVQLSNDAPQ
ncbi:MAG: hypothetical protein AAFV29_16670, partial [Myxococcota bacterium]